MITLAERTHREKNRGKERRELNRLHDREKKERRGDSAENATQQREREIVAVAQLKDMGWGGGGEKAEKNNTLIQKYEPYKKRGTF